MVFLSTSMELTLPRGSSFSHTEEEWRLMFQIPFLPVAQILSQVQGKLILQVYITLQNKYA